MNKPLQHKHLHTQQYSSHSVWRCSLLCTALCSADSFTLATARSLDNAKWTSTFLEPSDTSSNIQLATINTTQCFNWSSSLSFSCHTLTLAMQSKAHTSCCPWNLALNLKSGSKPLLAQNWITLSWRPKCNIQQDCRWRPTICYHYNCSCHSSYCVRYRRVAV